MRAGTTILLVLVLLYVPSASAAPRDCTGQNLPSTIAAVSLRCDETKRGEQTTRTEEVVVDLSGIEVGTLTVQHSHTWGTQSSARCSATWQPGPLVGGPPVQWGAGCAGVRHPLLP